MIKRDNLRRPVSRLMRPGRSLSGKSEVPTATVGLALPSGGKYGFIGVCTMALRSTKTCFRLVPVEVDGAERV